MQRRSYASTNTNTYNQAKNNTHAVNNNNTTQKHRLILDSLNVVPYEEYYEKNHQCVIKITLKIAHKENLELKITFGICEYICNWIFFYLDMITFF